MERELSFGYQIQRRYLEIENAEELPIIFNIAECNHDKKNKKEFATCRNWQFAYIYKNLF